MPRSTSSPLSRHNGLRWLLVSLVLFGLGALLFVSVSASSGPVDKGTPQPERAMQGSWTCVTGTVGANVWLNGIWGSSPSDLFAVGDGGAAYHYNGTAWSVLPTGTSSNLYDIWGTSPNNVYAVGVGTIQHWNGSGWSSVTSPSAVLRGIYGSGPNEIYAVGMGYSPTGPYVTRWKGSQWMTETIPPGPYDLWDVWASGGVTLTAGSGGLIFQRDPSGDWIGFSSPTSNDILAIWGASANDFFIGDLYGRAYRWNGSGWTPYTGVLSDVIYDMHGTSSNNIFVVGAYGKMSHFDGSTWSAINTGTNAHLMGVQVFANDVYAVGQNGTVVHCSMSVSPTSTPTPTATPTYTPTGSYTPVTTTPTPTPTPTSGYIPVTNTPTPTPTPAVSPTPTPTPVRNYHFQGQVTDSKGRSLADVLVQLLGYNTRTGTWDLLKQARTHRNGRFYLFRWENRDYFLYRLRVKPKEGYTAVRAETQPPGKVIDSSTIEYNNPPSGYYTKNKFVLGRIAILTMSGGGQPLQKCPDDNEWTVQRVTISVNEVSDWQVSHIAFQASGTGNEAQDIKEARLYGGNRLLGTATYNQDNGTIGFSVSIHIPAGSAVSLELRYVLDPTKLVWDNDAHKLARSYRTTTGVSRLSATPLQQVDKSEKLPPSPIVGPLHQVARVWNTSLSPWRGYGTVQAAVDGATTRDGHTLQVCPGTYTENVRVTKGLTIRPFGTAASARVASDAEADDAVIVMARDPNQSVFTLSKDNTTIQGLTIKGASGNGAAGILAAGTDIEHVLHNITLEGNEITGNYYGVFFRNVDGSRISHNNILDNASFGVYVGENDPTDEQHVTIDHNTIENNNAGIVVDGAWETVMEENTITRNGGGAQVHATADLPDAAGNGIHLSDVSEGIVRKNWVAENSNFGLVVEKSEIENVKDNHIDDNSINHNRGGVLIHGARNTLLTNNSLRNNAQVGLRIDGGQGTRFIKQGDDACLLGDPDVRGPAQTLVEIRNGAQETSLVGCTMTIREQDTGVYMEHSSGFTLSDVRIRGGHYGIHLKNASRIVIEGTEVSGQTEEGLRCEDSSDIEIRSKTNLFQHIGKRALAFYNCTPPRGDVNNLGDIQVSGSHTTENGFYFEGGHGFHVSSSTVSEVKGPAVVITGTQGIEVSRATVSDAPVGVSVAGTSKAKARDITVRESTFRNVSQAAVQAENVQNLRLEGNTVESAAAHASSTTGTQATGAEEQTGFHLSAVQSGQVAHNTVKNLGGQGLLIEKSRDVTVSDNTFQNMDGRGIVLSEAMTVTVSTNFILDNGGSGVLVWKGQGNRVATNIIHTNKGAGVALYETKQTVVSKNEIHKTQKATASSARTRSAAAPAPIPGENEGVGILVVRGSQNRLEENVVRQSASDGVRLDCYQHGVRSCAITDLFKNDIANNAGDGIYVGWGNYVDIKGDIVENNGDVGIYIFNSIVVAISNTKDEVPTRVRGHRVGIYIEKGGANRISQADIREPREYGILLENTRGNTVKYNEIRDPLMDGIRMVDAPSNTGWDGTDGTRGNEIYNARRYGIYLERSEENKLIANHIYDADLDGIYLSRSDKTILDGNQVYHSNEHGIVIERTNEATIKDNWVKQSQGHGIVLRRGSQKNTIESNEIGYDSEGEGNQGDGIYLEYAHKNTLKNNKILMNRGHGIFLTTSTGNKIERNTINENYQDGIHAVNSRKMEIRNNHLEDNRGNAIALVDSQVNNRTNRTLVRGNTLLRNEFAEDGKNGVYIDNATHIDVWHNRITGFPESGVYATNARKITIKWNTMLNNCDGITLVDTYLGPDTVAYNTIRNSWCLFSGIHLENATADIVGNEISGSTGDGIVATQGSAPTVRRNAIVNNGRDGVRSLDGSQPVLRENTFSGNEGMGVNNLDPSVTVDARDNWWGDASGPGGQGPGSGDAVSAGVDYGNWLAEPMGLALSVTPAEVPALPDSQVTAWLSLQSLSSLPLTVTVTAGDGQGWLPVGYQHTAVITEAAGILLPITVTVPADAAPGTANVVSVAAEGDGLSAHGTFTVSVVQPVAGVSIEGPLGLDPGQVVTYTAVVTPTDAPLVTYLWSPEPRSGQGTASAAFGWDEVGRYPIVVEVEQLGRTVREEIWVAVRGSRRLFLPAVMR